MRAVDFNTSIRNVRLMRLLDRVASAFNQARVPLLALKGAALNLCLYDQPGQRPMSDLDLLVKPECAAQACALLGKLGCVRPAALVREDFFPRFHYEVEYQAGDIFPAKIDLHVRPFRPLRYSRLVPDDALWGRATPVSTGRASVLVPCAEEMLIHLAAHAAIHGGVQPVWLRDIQLWSAAHRSDIDWERFLDTVNAWRLALPVRQAIERSTRDFGPVCPPAVHERLRRLPVNWRDRLALFQAPRDATHSVAHVLVNVLCTPGWRYALAYLSAVVFPARAHMGEWYSRRHRGWLPCAHLLRLGRPLVKRIEPLWNWLSKIETRPSPVHGTRVFARRYIRAGEPIARLGLTGKLRFLKHCCHPNAALHGRRLVALRTIQPGQEITINYGAGAGDCRAREITLDKLNRARAHGQAA